MYGTTFLQEYLITGPAELFAEIGGVMGLLLGWSILGSSQSFLYKNIRIYCQLYFPRALGAVTNHTKALLTFKHSHLIYLISIFILTGA